MSNTPCELCTAETDVSTYEVPKVGQVAFENAVQICATCRQQIENQEALDPNHWRPLAGSIWSENPAVKVLAWRILKRLSSEHWATDLFDQLYMEDDLLAWAQAGHVDDASDASASSNTRDSNGVALLDGDSVTLIKDLDVKGANFTAKRGTLVKNISLTDDPALISGRVNGAQIFLKTCFLKKAT
ncbi:MAG: PhnA domain protein [Deltaproteobacteria bacterium CG11_big_fil_rev_8_21_14_0_20_47_16]|nr:MAG: PhnA domain protein [Deltaproteobacteria bacterium CG11_big_fil_rev_8_21_14_0_20_47_16]